MLQLPPRRILGLLVLVVAPSLLALSLARRAAALSCATRELEILELEIESATLAGQPTDVPDWRRRGKLTTSYLVYTSDNGRKSAYVTIQDGGSP